MSNMYDILGKLKSVFSTETPAVETPAQPVYESVEPRGSITEAVKSLEAKFAKFNESAKPDFLDVDKDGNKKEPFKKAVKDKKEVDEGTIAKPKKDLRKHSATAKRMAMQKKADKGHEEWLDHLEKTDPDHPSLKYRKQATNEGAGPYTLDDPKHPKFKANYEKYKKAHPDCTLAEFVAAMRKKEKGLAEAAYDEPAAPDAEAIAKRKRLQAIKDRQEEQGDDYSDTKSNVRKVAGKAYGGAAQKDDEEKDLDENSPPAGFTDPGEKGATYATPVVTPAAAAAQASAPPTPTGPAPVMPTATSTPTTMSSTDLEEKAPPGAKAERMVKHIKAGYAKDGKLTNKEKAIAYATAWKAKKAGVVEATEFKDTIANSKAELKKAKPAMVKESKVMEETDYFYEKVGKALAEKNSYLDTAGSEFVEAVRKEMVAQGIPPNRARNILLMDEDFLSDVATSYGHYCQVDAHSPLPAEIDLNTTEELDEIAKLAGLPTKKSVCEKCGCKHDALEECAPALLAVGSELAAAAPAIAAVSAMKDEQGIDEMEKFQSMPKTTAPTPAAPPASTTKPTYDKSKLNPMREEEVEEGNEFSGALAKAKASGAKEFEVDGKKYTVKEDINVNITANGQEDALNLFRKLAGMDEVAPAVTGVEVPQDAESAIAQGIVEPVEVEVDEERDVEYANTPNEKIGPVGAAIPSGNDMHRAKRSYSDKPYRGDNPMAVKEAALWAKYESMINDIKK